MPGRRSTILNWPWSSVRTVRIFSMRAGLAASTVTPGSTAPVTSFTAPAMLPFATVCARAAIGRSKIPDTVASHAILCILMVVLLPLIRKSPEVAEPMTGVRDLHRESTRDLVGEATRDFPVVATSAPAGYRLGIVGDWNDRLPEIRVRAGAGERTCRSKLDRGSVLGRVARIE